MSDLISVERIIECLVLLIIVLIFAFIIAVSADIDSKKAFYNECLSNAKYDKFQCYSMIYGGRL